MSKFQDTHVTLPELMRKRAHEEPKGIFARIPVGPAYSSGFREVTNIQLRNAVDAAADLLSGTYGKSETFETLTYIGPADLRYIVVVLAGIIVGYKVFLPSPRNSIAAQVSLLTRLRCTKLAITEPGVPCVPAMMEGTDLQTVVIPSLAQLLEVEAIDHAVSEKTFADAKDDPIFVLHTSGSTGTPKPLVYTHEWVSRCFGSTTIPAVDGIVDVGHYITSGSLFLTLPPFHMAGVGLGLILALFHGYVTVYPLPGPPPTTEALINAISNTEVDWACVSPVVVDELGKRIDLLEVAASRLKYILYAGGSVPKASGDVVARKLTTLTILGSSEAGMVPLVHNTEGYNNAEDWVYMRFHPGLKSEMRHLYDDFYELVLVHNEETESFQPVFALFPTDKEYRTRDLFRPHPSKEDLWRHTSRIDDVIVFLNGEKTNPVSFEHQVGGHPEVKSALVLGAQRFEAGLLVETTSNAVLTDEEKTALIDRIWLTIEKANKLTPAYARVTRNMIVLTDPSKPMARAGKGTVQRAATLTLYTTEIDRLYEREEASDTYTKSETPVQRIKALVRNAVAEVVSIDDIDLFQLGMDSLGALQLQRALKKIVPNANFSNSTIYKHPSVNGLVKALENTVANGETSVTKSEVKVAIDDAVEVAQGSADTAFLPTNADTISTEELETALKVFIQKVNAIPARQSIQAPDVSTVGTCILLTGTTGAIGSYVLDILLASSDVAHVYCLNRTVDSRERQAKNNHSRGLATDFPPDRVTFMHGDLTKSELGLSVEDYTKLLGSITHVVHNAWPVNFSSSLAAFTPSIEGVVNLIRFTAKSKMNISLQFYSSIASVFNHPDLEVPESIEDKLTSPSPGYGQSKYIAELLVDQACRILNIRGSVVRIGQIAGAARTASGWNQHEWLPSLIITSAFLCVLPDSLAAGGENVEWVPIDHLAKVLAELTLIPRGTDLGASGADVYHIVHPHPVTWSSVLPIVMASIDRSGIAKQPMQVVSYGEWLSMLRTKGLEAAQDASLDYATLVRKIPGLKLIEFYEELQGGGSNTTLSMHKTCALSPSLAKLEPLKSSWIAGWVEEWLQTAEV